MYSIRKIFIALILLLSCSCSEAAKFIPEQPIMPVRELRPGMTGYILTVIKGTVPERIPIKIISIAPQKPGREISDEILLKFTGRHKLAQGMSGSPVYIRGKLVGAIRSGWEMSDQTLACAAPIESMCAVFDNDAASISRGINLANISISGLSLNNSSLQSLSKNLGMTFLQGAPLSSHALTLSSERFKPGDSVSAMLVWGDVEVGATGTVTATSRDGRFLAFGHALNKSGNSSYPAAKTYIHEIVNNFSFPFKLASPQTINGTFTQDREAGVAGRMSVYPPSISAGLIFRDLDTGRESSYKFRVIADEFMSKELLVKVFTGLCEEAWGRKGHGTMSVNLRIDGKAVPNGWARKDIFWSDENIIENAFKQAGSVIYAYMTQPFSETMPAGFTLTVEATQKPRVLLIEDVTLSADTAKPGEEVGVTVKLRGWRTKPTEHKFTLKIPDDASAGVCELVVRGGNTDAMRQIALDEGWKSIDSLQRLLSEFKAADANNELFLELNTDRLTDALNKALASKKDKSAKHAPDLIPEQEEYLSETKARRIEEGNLRIFRSDYFIDGMMKRIIHVEN